MTPSPTLFAAPIADCADAVPPRSQRGDWTWELVTQFPRQGDWTEDEYLQRSFEGLVEYVDGKLEFLPMVTPFHQDIQMFLYHALLVAAAGSHPGRVYVAPLRVRIRGGLHREPDVLLVRPEHIPNRQRPAVGADLAIEVVSGSAADRERDYREKRIDYASIGIREYWIVDPDTEAITVLILPNGATEYREHGTFRPGQQATSVLLPEFAVEVAACFAAGRGETAERGTNP